MAAGDYTHTPTPEGIALDLCPCCGSNPGMWQYIESDESATKAVMCTNGAAFGPQDGAADEGCPLYMPPQGFYRATIREAVAYWNAYAKELTKQQRKNRWMVAQVLRTDSQETTRMTTPQPQGLPPLPDDEKLEGRLYQDVREFVSPQVKGVIRELMQAYAREALRAQAATLESIHQIIQCAGPDAAGEIADLLGYPSVEWADSQAASVEPVLYASPKQPSAAIAGTLSGFENLKPEFGGYLPVRTEQGGLFTSPLYAGAPPSQASVPADVEAMNARQAVTIKRMRKALASIHARLRPDSPPIDSHALSLITVECETADPELVIERAAQRPEPSPAQAVPRTLKGMAEAVAHLPDPWCEPAQADAASEAFTGIANDDDFWTALDAWLARAALTAKDRK